ncbi:MAG TPA: DUF3810 family protein [Vicinamibacterales bacterium]|nr:DUF3810 family protein [Vicinamibacterales bacterium]
MKRAAWLATAALAAALAPFPPAWVDTVYSSGVYPCLQAPVTSTSNLAPFALFDALVLTVAAAWLAALAVDVRRAGVTRAALAAVVRTVTWGAAAYLAFLLLWGFNYRRVPLARRLDFDAGAVTPAAARRLAAVSVDRLNALASDAHRLGWRETSAIDPALRDGLARTTRDLGLTMPVVGRPKRTLLDLYFRRAGVEGMTDPYLLETLVVSDLLPFERPLVIAHEWGHLAGLADESAANFAGWLACVHGSIADQYSGWLFLYEELAAALPRRDRDAIAALLGAVPRADLAAARARVARNIQPQVSAAAWRAYDSYLKSNRVEAGTRSYDEVVQLVLGTRFGDDWTPRRR